MAITSQRVSLAECHQSNHKSHEIVGVLERFLEEFRSTNGVLEMIEQGTAVAIEASEITHRLGRVGVTRVERNILSQVLYERGNKQIALEVGICEATVRSHLMNVRKKLGVKRGEAMLSAILGNDASELALTALRQEERPAIDLAKSIILRK